MKRLNDFETCIIAGIAADVSRISALDWQADAIPYGRQRGRYRMAIDDAKKGVVATEPSRWLARQLSPSDMVKISRTYASLEAAGLIERHALTGGRTTHLSLTETGRKHAKLIELRKELANAK